MFNFKIPLLNKSLFSTNLTIRIYDINYGNHLGHDSLISLLHESRIQFLKHLGYSESNVSGLGILITNLVVNYLNEAFYSNKIIINIGIGDISHTSLELIYQVLNHETNKELARAITLITFYDYEKLKVSKIPLEFLQSIEIDNCI